MNESTEFAADLERIRRGDSGAISQFVERYAPFIRRTLRFRIRDAALQSAADSVDLCQSVLGSFLIRFTAGDYVIATETDLRRLLASIAHKKFLMLRRREHAGKRDRFRTLPLDRVDEPIADASYDSSQQFQHSEILKETMRRFSADELALYQLRSQGNSWLAVSQQLGESESVLRQRLSRAIRRISSELGLGDDE